MRGVLPWILRNFKSRFRTCLASPVGAWYYLQLPPWSSEEMGASGGTCVWPFLCCWLHSEHLQVCYSVPSKTLQMIFFCSWQPFLFTCILRGVLLLQSPVVYLFKVWQSRPKYTCKKGLDLCCSPQGRWSTCFAFLVIVTLCKVIMFSWNL